jgi:hypothetical protein
MQQHEALYLELTGKPGLSQFGKILCSRRMIPEEKIM